MAEKTKEGSSISPFVPALVTLTAAAGLIISSIYFSKCLKKNLCLSFKLSSVKLFS